MQLKTYAHFLTHALRLRWSDTHRVPLTVNVSLLNQCCNRCLYCAQETDGPDRLPPVLLGDVFREAWSIGARRVNLSGGEPLLRDDLAEIVGSAKDLGFFVSLSTSGARAHRQLDALGRVDRVMLSFDGPEAVREKLCGPGSARRADEAVRAMSDAAIPFWTTTVLTAVNIPHIDWIVDHARRHDTQANFVLLMTQPETGGRLHPLLHEVEAIFPTEEENRRALRRLIALKRGGAPVGSSLPYLEELLEWPDYRNLMSPRRSRRYRCLASRASCELMPDGMLYSCGWSMIRRPGVSVRDHGFAGAFARLEPMPDCRSCASSCELESNLIFSLNARTVLNWCRRVG